MNYKLSNVSNTYFAAALGDPIELQWTKLPMIRDAHCKSIWGRKFFEKEMICAGFMTENSTNTCTGDSGGPLMCHQNGQTVLTGIVSWGKRGCVRAHPKVFARVSNYIEWIQSHMEESMTSFATTEKQRSRGLRGYRGSFEYSNSQEYVNSQKDVTTEYITTADHMTTTEIMPLFNQDSGSCPTIPKFMRSSIPQARIIGGQKAHNSIPWQVSLQKPDGSHGCGGVILDKMTILTAAHCVRKKGIDYTKWHVVAGQVDRKLNQDRIRIVKVIIHPKNEGTKIVFRNGKPRKTWPNDIGILKLSEPLALSKTIQPMCLPSEDFKPFEGEMCFVSGWGKTNYCKIFLILNYTIIIE